MKFPLEENWTKGRNDFCTELSLSVYPACDCVPDCVPTEAVCPGVLMRSEPSLRIILKCNLETSCHVTYLLSVCLCAYMFYVCVPQEPLARVFFLN